MLKFLYNDPIMYEKYSEIIIENSKSFLAIPINERLLRVILPMLHSSYVIDK